MLLMLLIAFKLAVALIDKGSQCSYEYVSLLNKYLKKLVLISTVMYIVLIKYI